MVELGEESVASQDMSAERFVVAYLAGVRE